MAGPSEALILDLLEWLAARPRTYREVMDAWRTSCPRLTVWEDATEEGYVARASGSADEQVVRVTASGLAFLAANGRGRTK